MYSALFLQLRIERMQHLAEWIKLLLCVRTSYDILDHLDMYLLAVWLELTSQIKSKR
jgi:hypothetical protein